MAALHSPLEDRAAFRLAAIAGVVGVVAQIVFGSLHAGTVDPNDSVDVFPQYAASGIWTAVHLGQFAGTVLIGLGLLGIALAAVRRGGLARALGMAGIVTVLLATAVFAVQMAVDGIVLRETIRAWVDAPATVRSKATLFAVADTVRWTEKALSAFFHLNNGTSLVLIGLAVVVGRFYPWWLGAIGATSGLGFLYGAWLTAQAGFSAESSSVLSPFALVAVVFLVGSGIAAFRATRGPRGASRESIGRAVAAESL